MQSLQTQTGQYDDFRHRESEKYREAWKSAPERFKSAAAKAGIKGPSEDKESGYASEYNPDTAASSYSVDMSSEIDTELDNLIERFGVKNEPVIRATFIAMQEPIKRESERERAATLGRLAGYLVKTERQNTKVRIHGIFHAIPRMASANGFASMHISAAHCGCTVEAIRKARNSICEVLRIPIPVEGTKSGSLRDKCRENALTNHWRNQKVNSKRLMPIIKSEPTKCTPNQPTPTN